MINFESFELENGLKVYFHEDKNTPLVALNILYNVGSRDENPDKTGFAHLFEHLMFGGSAHIPNYDTVLQQVGGENNAFTSTDITNYYITLPAQNAETAFWLESDRMLSLSFDPKVLEIQRSVVIEEFKQRYLNQPYGDVWLKIRPLAYQVHPYNWATIGKEISHIENATMDDVKAFFQKYYIPNNAIMVVAGNIKLSMVKKLSEKWFAPIPKGNPYLRNLPSEPKQTEKRTLTTSAKVPQNAIYKAYHMPEKMHPMFNSIDLMSDILGRGQSSHLYQELVKSKKIFNSIGAYVLGSNDPGLLMIEGKINDNFSFDEAENAINESIETCFSTLNEQQLEKVKNQAETSIVLEEIDLLRRAMYIAFGANLGNANLINEEKNNIQKITKADILAAKNNILTETNSSVLYYQKQN